MKIVLGISGSIASYRNLDIARELARRGHTVRVVFTKGGERFLRPELFEYLGVDEVYSSDSDFKNSSKGEVLHVALARWCDQVVVAGASANTLAKCAYGLCDDLLSTLFLTLEQKPILFLPSMNPSMLGHPNTLEALERLSKRDDVTITNPDSGEMVCGETGQGRLPSWQHVVEIIEASLAREQQLAGKRVLITAGATVSALDPVRYLTNPSTGMMGLKIAQVASSMGAQVSLIAGIYASSDLDALTFHPKIQVTRAHSTHDMLAEVQDQFGHCDYYISSAAINDISFKTIEQKLKKNQFPDALAIEKAPDILAHVLRVKSHQTVVGFAAESATPGNGLEEVIQAKIESKPVDLLVANTVHNGNSGKNVSGFGNASTDYQLWDRSGKLQDLNQPSKGELALAMWNQLLGL